MRYIYLVFAMLGDVGVLLASAYLLYSQASNPIVWVLVALGYDAWSKNGAFMCWIPSEVKEYLKNARKIGW